MHLEVQLLTQTPLHVGPSREAHAHRWRVDIPKPHRTYLARWDMAGRACCRLMQCLQHHKIMHGLACVARCMRLAVQLLAWNVAWCTFTRGTCTRMENRHSQASQDMSGKLGYGWCPF